MFQKNRNTVLTGSFITALFVVLPFVSAQETRILKRDGQVFEIRGSTKVPHHLTADVLRHAGAKSDKKAITPDLFSMPMMFEKNIGQGPRKAAFVTRGTRYSAALMPDGIALAVVRHDPRAEILKQKPSKVGPGITGPIARIPVSIDAQPTPLHLSKARAKGNRIRLTLIGAHHRVPSGSGKLKANVHHLIGNDKRKWHHNIPVFSSVRYKALYPGIDMFVHGQRAKLQYGFVVGPKTTAKNIRIKVDGAVSLELDNLGNLIMKTTGGPIVQSKPRFAEEKSRQKKRLKG